jgi:hypothetical protein
MEVASNKSSLLQKINYKTQITYKYLQFIKNQKIFTKDIKNAEWQGLGCVDLESYK